LVKSPGAVVKVDLASQAVTLPSGRTVEFTIDSFAKQCLLDGVDELGYMLRRDDAIRAFEAKPVGSANTLGLAGDRCLLIHLCKPAGRRKIPGAERFPYLVQLVGVFQGKTR
jgi:hypothetical protein